MKIISGDISVELEPDGTLVFRKETTDTVDFYGKLTQEELDKIDQSKGEIFLDFPCPKCDGEVEHEINCPDGIPFNDEKKMTFCRRMKMPDTGTEPKEGDPYGSIRYAAFDKFKPAGGGEK